MSNDSWQIYAVRYAHHERMANEIPYPIACNVGEVLGGHRRSHELVSSRDHIIPGHDPLVMDRYPVASVGLEGWVARLD